MNEDELAAIEAAVKYEGELGEKDMRRIEQKMTKQYATISACKENRISGPPERHISVKSSGGIVLLCLWLIVACCSCEAQLYRRTVKEKCKQVLLFPWRYARLVLLDDFGIRESIWMAAEYDYLWR